MRFTGRLDAFPRLRPWAGLITIALAATVVTPAQAGVQSRLCRHVIWVPLPGTAGIAGA